MSYYVNYEIAGVEYQAGPYSETGVATHRDDIRSYAGVSKVWIGDRDPKRKLIGSEPA
jgi:hypothetical protein